MLKLLKHIFKLSYFLSGLLVIYVFLIIFLNTSYTRYLIANLLTKALPGKFNIEALEVSHDLSKLHLKKVSILAPKSEEVITVDHLIIKLSPYQLVKTLIQENKIAVDSVTMDQAFVNILIRENYVNIAETFYKLKKSSKFNDLVFKRLHQNNFLLFSDSELIHTSPQSDTPLQLLFNNITIKNTTVQLDILDKIKIKSQKVNLRNASFQLLPSDILIRADGSIQDAMLNIADNKIKIDRMNFYGYEEKGEYIKLDKAFIDIKSSRFETEAKLGMDILSRFNINLEGSIKTSIIEALAKENNIQIPKKIELGDNVTIEASLFGSTDYPLLSLNLLIDRLKYDDMQFKNGVLEAYYQTEQSDVSFYLREISYKNKKIERIRTNVSINNLDTLKLETLSMQIKNGGIKGSGSFNFNSGALKNIRLQVKNFNPEFIKSFMPASFPQAYIGLLSGHLNTRLNLNADDIYKAKNIRLKLYTHYRLFKKEIFGDYIQLNTQLLYDQGKLSIQPSTYLNSSNLSFKTNGFMNLNKQWMRLSFDLQSTEFETLLKQFNINELSGNAHIKGSAKGFFNNPLLKANIHLSQFDYLHYKNNDISTDIKLENGLAQLYGLSVTNKDFTSFITAKAKLYENNINRLLKEPQFSLFVNLEEAKIGSIIKNDKIDLKLNTEVILYGTPSKLGGSIKAYANRFLINQEPFDSFQLNLTFKEDEKTKHNILNVDTLNIKKDKRSLLDVIGHLDLKTFNYELEGLIPRLKIENFVHLQSNGSPLFLGDAISSLFIKGNLLEQSMDYDIKMRLASCAYPYSIEQTKTIIKPSDEFGKPNDITFKKVNVPQKLNLGSGLLHIQGNEKQAYLNGKLFNLLNIKTTLSNLFTHPVATIDFDIKEFPVDKFYTAPIKSMVSLTSHLKLDLLQKKVLFGRVIFDDITLKLGDITINESPKKISKDTKYCVVTEEGVKVRKNCVEFINDKLFVDIGISFLEEHINISGSILTNEEKIKLNVYGGINLKSFAYFKDIFSSVDGNAYIYSSVTGSFSKPKYNFNLRIKKASFQPNGFDKDITIDNAQISLRQDKVYVKNVKGNLLGGDFEITGNPQENNLIYDLGREIAYLNVKANNLEYNLPDVANVEASLDMTLKGNIKNLKLSGKTRVIDGKFYKEINIVDNILNPITKKTEVYEEGVNLKTVPILKNISLNVNIINEGLTISNNLMSDVAVKANLTILGTLGAPIIEGEITAKDGSVNLLRNSFDLTKLGIVFNKTDLMSSKLEFEAESIIKDYDPISDEYNNRNVSLIISGRLNDPKVELVGEGLTKVQTLMLLLTGQSGLNNSGTVVNDDRGSKITNQVFSLLLQNSLNKLTSDFTKQTDISIQTSINSSGGLSVSANKRIAERVVVTGVGEYEDNTLQKQISAEIIITDQLVIEILKAFEEGTTDLGLKYRLNLK